MFKDHIGPGLERLGWTPLFHQRLLALQADPEFPPDARPERVVEEWRGEYGVLGAHGARRCVLSGRLARDLSDEQRPCVGDFVLVAAPPGSPVGRIERVLERTGVLRRKSPGRSAKGQAIAANVDVAFIVNALAPEAADARVVERSLNARRIERYLRAVREANARAVVVVAKADLRAKGGEQAAMLAKELGLPEVLLVSAHSGVGLDDLRERLGPGTTGVLVGSSGVGKSSLVNRLLGHEAQAVRTIREKDARGRHTTTHRRLFVLPEGGLLIDTPGMRELALFADESTDTEDAGFDNLGALAGDCRFRDCRHLDEPGCAVLLAVERGELSAERLEHAHQLERELAWQQRRHDARQRRQTRIAQRPRSVHVREALRQKGKLDD
jgi:ribosome biogenesis GTPase